MLVCKLLQALSNRVIISSKEEFMAPLASFIDDNMPVLDQFYDDIEVRVLLTTPDALQDWILSASS